MSSTVVAHSRRFQQLNHCAQRSTLRLTAMERASQALVVVGLVAAMLALPTVNCRPSAPSVLQSQPAGENGDQTASREVLSGAVGTFLLSTFLRLFQNQFSRSPTTGSQQSRVQQGPGQELPDPSQLLENEMLNELIEFYLNSQPQLPQKAQSTKTHEQENGRASVQFISRDTWNIARECLNDIFSPNDGGTPGQAAVSEVKRVLAGQMALSQASAQVRLNWPIIRSCVDRFANRNNPSGGARPQFLSFLFDDDCIVNLQVIAITAATQNSHTTDPPFLEMTVGSEVKSLQLQMLSGNEFQRGKGDVWNFDMAEFGFSQSCIEVGDVDGLALVEGGTDGWKIASVVTLVTDDDGQVSLLSSDIGADRWIDGNGGEERRRFDLTLYNK